ncbi:hypothetical protein Q7P37_001729 [Cladosporium fusiforme]
MSRNEAIAASICESIAGDPHKHDPTFTQSVTNYFNTSKLIFTRVHENQFKSLRETWKIGEDDYRKSFTSEDDDDENKGSALASIGDMGFSGSTFFNTTDGKFLVKSVPRHFEHSFFKDEMLVPYADHLRHNLYSLLVRITDFLEAQRSMGSTLGLAPSHHIVMENTKFGENDDKREGVEWETWDLKPMSYFYPERDVAGGALTSEETKNRLADDFSEKIVLSIDDAADFRANLQKDTAFLAKMSAVDYSLFLVRIPVTPEKPEAEADGSPDVPLEPPLVPPGAPSWRTGVKSADGKYIYRAAVLDFFWAKHKVHAQAMTGLINTYNLVDKQGPMSVTTTSEEYRERFLKMCDEMVEVK